MNKQIFQVDCDIDIISFWHTLQDFLYIMKCRYDITVTLSVLEGPVQLALLFAYAGQRLSDTAAKTRKYLRARKGFRTVETDRYPCGLVAESSP